WSPLSQPMYSTTARRAAARVGRGCSLRHSPFRDAKNDSASALSQHCPVRPCDKTTSRPPARMGVVPTGVLAAAIGMEDDPGCGIAGGDGVGQRVRDEL